MLPLRKEHFEVMPACAAEREAERALAHIGVESSRAADEIGELRDLLEVWRAARRAAGLTVIKVATMGLLAPLLVGAAIKLRLMGGPQ